MRYGRFVSASGQLLDEITAVYMPRGKSYTGWDQVEIFCHGGRQVVQMIQSVLVDAGARPAEPGEFTKLAFLNGRIDLSRAEAVAEVVAANTRISFEASREHLLGAYSEHMGQIRKDMVRLVAEVEAGIDFVEEDLETTPDAKLVGAVEDLLIKLGELLSSYTGGRIISEGYRIVIGGRPNVGKSSLFNLLLRQERALVHPSAGTTRDYLSEWLDLGGFAVNLIDTAGFRRSRGAVERKGQEKAQELAGRSNLLLWMVDLSRNNWRASLAQDRKQLSDHNIMLIGNKVDLVKAGQESRESDTHSMPRISCITGGGVKKFKAEVIDRIGRSIPDLTDGLVVTSSRHKQKLASAVRNLKLARKKISAGESPELTAFDLRQAVLAIDEITGRVYTEDILDHIFSQFCVGK